MIIKNLKVKSHFKCLHRQINATLLMIVMLFTACDKTDIDGYPYHIDEQSGYHVSETKADQTELRMLYIIWDTPTMDYIYFCAPPAFDCLSTVIITPGDDDKNAINLMEVYDDFLEYFYGEKLNEFSRNYKSGYDKLFPYLKTDDGTDFLLFLQEEQYDVYQKLNYQEESKMFIFAPKGQNNVDGLIENAVLTLQVKVVEK